MSGGERGESYYRQRATSSGELQVTESGAQATSGGELLAAESYKQWRAMSVGGQE